MPTVIALDVSLSMCRPIVTNYAPDTPEDEIPTRKKLAIEAVNQFLDHVSVHCKLEWVAMLAFSTLYEVLAPFTRDLDVIRSHLNSLADFDKTNFDAALNGITTMVTDHWGNTAPVQILLVTDGSPGFGSGSLRETIDKAKPFPFPAKLNILSISDPDDKNYSENCQMLQQLIEITCGDGVVYFPESHLSSKGCVGAVSRLCAKDFTPYKGVLRCGQLRSKITLCPPPQPHVLRFDEKRIEISETIDIIGFVTTAELGSPAAHSRHLLLPLRSTENGAFPDTKPDTDDGDDLDGRTPNFCVLLHGAMKVESLCAIVEVGENWFGCIYSWADNKRKSNLMLSVLPPGSEVVPWLGNLQDLGSRDELVNKMMKQLPPNTPLTTMPSFPVKALEKKSYASNPTVWVHNLGINADIQKLLRHARKLPDKTPQFFKELNRMRKWALTIGFTEILESIAQVLERECMASSSAHPEATIQLTHAATQLRAKLSYTKTIQPHRV